VDNKISVSYQKPCYKVGTQFGTQKCAEHAGEAVDAEHAVQIFTREI
jgi:hypothetical protein